VAATAPPAVEVPASPEVVAALEERGARKKQRFDTPTVYVDGVPIIAFTYNEMPPGVKVGYREWEPGEPFAHVLVCDYLQNLGVDCAEVLETHWYAGRDRIAVISGDELRRNRRRLYFNFTRELFGKPRIEWTPGLRVSDHVDVASDLAVYVHKKPPRWSRDYWALLDDRGNAIDGIPYSTPGVRGGVRVNLDGRLVARIKRNLLEGNVTPVRPPQGDEEARYSISAILDSQRIHIKSFRGIDLVTADERVVRLAPAELRAGVELSAERQRHGEVTVYFGGHSVAAVAINVYARLAPPERPMRKLLLRDSVTPPRAASEPFTPTATALSPARGADFARSGAAERLLR
jgi:hypothetical protein